MRLLLFVDQKEEDQGVEPKRGRERVRKRLAHFTRLFERPTPELSILQSDGKAETIQHEGGILRSRLEQSQDAVETVKSCLKTVDKRPVAQEM
ncbi:MAG TPA: hypothetical protein VF791_01160 [Pyrinomonadaceae bacterium]